MIVLPDDPGPSTAHPVLIDFGFVQRPATGAALSRVDRPGSRFRIDFAFPPMPADVARVVVSRLIAARSEGLRIELPLMGVSQGAPGAPVVDGAGAAGSSLPLRGLTPGYQIKEGFWLTAIDAAGVHYLHNVRATTAADASGEALLTIAPILRAPLADGDAVLLAKVLVEGVVTEDVAWDMTPGEIVTGLGFTLEEAA
jgi:hypothetical protein